MADMAVIDIRAWTETIAQDIHNEKYQFLVDSIRINVDSSCHPSNC